MNVKMTSETNFDTNPIGTCLMPVFLDEHMIVCDSCKKWYHYSCILADGNISDCLMCFLCKSVELECLSARKTHKSSVQLFARYACLWGW